MDYAELSNDIREEVERFCTISWDDYVELCWQAEQDEADKRVLN